MPDKPEVVGSSPTVTLRHVAQLVERSISPVIKQPPLLVTE